MSGIIYNVTIKVDHAIADDWLQWLKYEHAPDVMKTKCFLRYRILRLLDTDDSEGPTYAIQYEAESKADYNRYIEIHSAALRKDLVDKWGNAFIAFRTVMEIV